MPKEKSCNKCKKVKPLSDFYPMTHGKYGLKGHCKQCEKIYRDGLKKPKMPKENEQYVVNKITMNNHFYLHFGFVDKMPVLSEYALSSKYQMQPPNPNIKNAK